MQLLLRGWLLERILSISLIQLFNLRRLSLYSCSWWSRWVARGSRSHWIYARVLDFIHYFNRRTLLISISYYVSLSSSILLLQLTFSQNCERSLFGSRNRTYSIRSSIYATSKNCCLTFSGCFEGRNRTSC